MVAVCLYFQVHQPNRLKKYTYFDIGHNHSYEDNEKNCEILKKVATKCYLPTNQLLLHLIEKYKGKFKVSFSLSGSVIEQFKQFSPETLDSFKQLAQTGCVEFLNETFHHSLSFLFSKEEFKEQVQLHHDLIKKEFGYEGSTFRNTELIYNNELAKQIEEMGYKTILTEGADKILNWRSPNFVYQPIHFKHIKLFLKNYRLSDDIAFRFSNISWKEFPLTSEKFAHWVHRTDSHPQVVNLFMDYETFGEHQWYDTGIFEFLKELPNQILKHPDFEFMTLDGASKTFSPVSTLDIPHFISWADTERDLTAWKGNALQEDALNTLYSMEKRVKAVNNEDLLTIWRRLQASDHFYYMCVKYSQDGDVHHYFNPYKNPYEAYINFQNVLCDFSRELEKRTLSLT